MASAGLLTIAVLLLIGVIQLVFGLLAVVLRGVGLVVGQRQAGPYEISRRRAVGATFVMVFCFYVLRTGAWLLAQLPPWVQTALMVVAGLSVLFLLASLHGARNGPIDLFGAVASLVVAGGCAALLWWQWYIPADYLGAYEANRMLPGVYIAMMVAAFMRALICIRLFGGAQRIVARAIRQRSMSRRPALAGGFWEQTRAAFEEGRGRRPD